MVSTLGDDMLSKIGRTPTGSKLAEPDWQDDDGTFAGAVSTAPSTLDLADTLVPQGSQVRPNGATYHPRSVAEVFEDVALLRSARDHQEHVLFYGPPGTGKTALCEAAFAQDATDEHDGLESIVGTADTTEMDFIGTFIEDPATKSWTWQPGPLHRSVLLDVPLLVDEIALIDPRVLSVLYPLMDGRGVLRFPMNPQLEPLTVGKGWFVIAAFNPDVPGARLSEALRDRFEHHLEVGTDWGLAANLGVSPDIITVARNLDERRRKGTLAWSPQLRSLLSFARHEQRRGREYALANLLGKVPPDDRDVVHGVLTQMLGKVIHRLELGKQVES
ncbi:MULTISPECIES: AAA family ATPase [Amycolatopsis]|uniref:AAA domain (Dynein-related subfamily) n=1 Tax=Amycolatopsis saalfeldensis TaxID=394193 RepID=A0A1H8YNA9_9PSEU|nr:MULTISPECIES: AAA family ATPase [Amycolatopsis]SEP53695.1 AAA domain (dynein-related subfamily) [Amycolatopsis saalfeldensis]